VVGVGATWGIRGAANRRRPGAIGVVDMRREHRKPTRAELALITSRRPVVRLVKKPANKAQRAGPQPFFERGLTNASKASEKEVRSVTTSEQERVESVFEESSLSFEEKRRQRHALDWIDYHERQVRALEATLGCLVHEHQREQARHRQMLSGIATTEGEENERTPE
jgi:hypothetical protein